MWYKNYEIWEWGNYSIYCYIKYFNILVEIFIFEDIESEFKVKFFLYF